MQVFVRPSENPKLSSGANDRNITFKLGFSFDGLRAENMSINVVSTNNKKTTH